MPERFYDNTRVSTHGRCGRMYFYRHVADIRRTGWAAPLVFGASWHEAMNVVWREVNGNPNQQTTKVARLAFGAFEEKWFAEGGPHEEAMTEDEVRRAGPRTFDTAAEMLVNYIDKRREFIASCELLGTEVPFAVPLDPNDPTLWYCGRLDKVVRKQGRVFVIEHKTTTDYKIIGYFKESFTESFSPNSQVDGYAYAGHMLYPDTFKGVYIDGALVHKKVHEGFTFIPIERQFDQLDAWLWETRRQIQRIEEDQQQVEYASITPHNILEAFPKNTQSCWHFGNSCQFLDLCKSWANPLKHLSDQPPEGFAVERWDPFDHIALERLGFKRPGEES